MDADRFSRSTIETLARRAAYTCSNLNCNAITSGPADDQASSVIVGEAAHIYGARPGSARYDAAMTAAERSSIANGIWLCRNCHKIIDDDQVQNPAGLLFEWRRAHEQTVQENLGKASADAKEKYLKKHMKEFERESYLAQQIVIDKPDFWEYLLTAELLRTKLAPILSRWHFLERGFYAKTLTRVSKDDVLDWFHLQITEIGNQTSTITPLTNSGFAEAWGEPGVPGSELEILHVSNLFAETCQRLLECEERIRSSLVPAEFDEVKSLLAGRGGRVLDRVSILPIKLTEIFSQENPSGTYKISFVIDLPDGWSENVDAALLRAVQAAFE